MRALSEPFATALSKDTPRDGPTGMERGEPQVYLIHVAPTDSVGSGSVLLSWHMFICAEKQSPSFSFQPAHGLSCTNSCEYLSNKAFGWMGKTL